MKWFLWDKTDIPIIFLIITVDIIIACWIQNAMKSSGSPKEKLLIHFHALCGKSSFVTTDIILFGEYASKDAISLQSGVVF